MLKPKGVRLSLFATPTCCFCFPDCLASKLETAFRIIRLRLMNLTGRVLNSSKTHVLAAPTCCFCFPECLASKLEAVGKTKTRPNWAGFDKLVGKTGFEPATLWSQTRCATGLRYFPSRDPSWTRTNDLLLRRQLLYPAELWGQWGRKNKDLK